MKGGNIFDEGRGNWGNPGDGDPECPGTYEIIPGGYAGESGIAVCVSGLNRCYDRVLLPRKHEHTVAKNKAYDAPIPLHRHKQMTSPRGLWAGEKRVNKGTAVNNLNDGTDIVKASAQSI